ncbi:hypothetical protein EMPG_10315 [Blastomyces silverae]|uniref:Uncharacterized protein n=1 Tax=Blastomyces silverae TaxID=2060906 RepID=A0A0H1B499_9EURO|nr:hypothetical protein EMPG_10315 [Blastomyces silverae]
METTRKKRRTTSQLRPNPQSNNFQRRHQRRALLSRIPQLIPFLKTRPRSQLRQPPRKQHLRNRSNWTRKRTTLRLKSLPMVLSHRKFKLTRRKWLRQTKQLWKLRSQLPRQLQMTSFRPKQPKLAWTRNNKRPTDPCPLRLTLLRNQNQNHPNL